MHHRTLLVSKPSFNIVMALVDYSGSEDSDQEEQTKTQEAARGKVNTTKPSFQKVVDRSNSHKIQVNLPDLAKPEELDGLERPSKRAKVGSGGFSGFNSLLPAPKRTAAPNGARKSGLGIGVNLKTAAAPGFSRDPVDVVSISNEKGAETERSGDMNTIQRDEEMHQKPPAIDESLSLRKPVEAVKMQGNTTMFKPLSVARKPQKKKAQTAESLPNTKVQANEFIQVQKPAPKLSLFSTGEEIEPPRSSSTASGTYQPIIYTNTTPDPMPASVDPSSDLQPSEDPNYYPYDHPEPRMLRAPPVQSLTSIASDLNLTRAETRQLLGRQKHNHTDSPSTINIVNFNTDAEYAANEILRQAGETVQHNPVRAIAPGKHSLKQLVNAASSQKDALEESFASGRRNKKEAGSKYGW